VPEQLPGEGEEPFLVAPDRDQRARAAGVHRLPQALDAVLVEEEGEEETSERGSPGDQLGPLGIGLHRYSGEAIEEVVGNPEFVVALPRRRDRAGLSRWVRDAQRFLFLPLGLLPGQVEDQVLSRNQPAGVSRLELARPADQVGDLPGNPCGVAIDRADRRDRGEDRWNLGRFQQDQDQAAERAVVGEERAPLLVNPRARAVRREDEDQEPAPR